MRRENDEAKQFERFNKELANQRCRQLTSRFNQRSIWTERYCVWMCMQGEVITEIPEHIPTAQLSRLVRDAHTSGVVAVRRAINDDMGSWNWIEPREALWSIFDAVGASAQMQHIAQVAAYSTTPQTTHESTSSQDEPPASPAGQKRARPIDRTLPLIRPSGYTEVVMDEQYMPYHGSAFRPQHESSNMIMVHSLNEVGSKKASAKGPSSEDKLEEILAQSRTLQGEEVAKTPKILREVPFSMSTRRGGSRSSQFTIDNVPDNVKQRAEHETTSSSMSSVKAKSAKINLVPSNAINPRKSLSIPVADRGPFDEGQEGQLPSFVLPKTHAAQAPTQVFMQHDSSSDDSTDITTSDYTQLTPFASID
eukprot:gene41627-51569_t